MLVLSCNETYGAMTNHDDGDDNRDNDRNKDRNYDENVASGLRITTSLSHLDLKEYWEIIMTTMRPWRPIYLRIVIYISYKYSINAVINMCHKLMYGKLTFSAYAAKIRKKTV